MAPTIPYMKHSDWQMAKKGNKLFFYYKNSLEPKYIFIKSESSHRWKYNGKYYSSITECKEWVQSRHE